MTTTTLPDGPHFDDRLGPVQLAQSGMPQHAVRGVVK